MKAILALAVSIAAVAAAQHAESGSRTRHAPSAAHRNVRCLALITRGAKHPLSLVRRPPGAYRPRRGDFGFF